MTLQFTTPVRYVHDWTNIELYDQDTGHDRVYTVRRTVAMAADNDGNLYAGVSTCSPHDQFERRIGRVRAGGRLRGHAQNHFYVVRSFEELVAAIGDGRNEPVEQRGRTSVFAPAPVLPEVNNDALRFCYDMVKRDLTPAKP